VFLFCQKIEREIKMKKKWLVSLLAVVVVVLGACASGEEASGDDPINIGTLQNIDHASMTAAEDGFYQALADNDYVEGENIEVESLSAQGSQSNLNPMAQQAADENDLILSLGTAAGQALANVEQEKPVIFSAVTDPIDAGLVESQEEPGRNMTGTSDSMPVDQQINLLLSLDPEAEAVGVIYDSSESNSAIQADEAINAIEEAGLEAVVTTVSSTNDVQQNLSSIASDIDLLYAPTDNTIASTIPTVRDITVENQIPSVFGAAEMVEDGGLATYSINYESLGYQAGEMAVEILEGNAEPATMPYENAEELELVVNEDIANELGIDSESIEVPE